MPISIFDLFTIGIGPSSSHSVGPMRAANHFAKALADQGQIAHVAKVVIQLYGSLALTGKGHGTDKAVLLGLAGETPEGIDPNSVEGTISNLRDTGQLRIDHGPSIPFVEAEHLHFLRKQTLPKHSNGLRFEAFDSSGKNLFQAVYYSTGGGFVIDDQGRSILESPPIKGPIPYPYQTGAELLEMACKSNLSVSEMTWQNEMCWRDRDEIQNRLIEIWEAMQACVWRGCHQEGILPGGLKVRRRAPQIYKHLCEPESIQRNDPLAALDWVDLYALAVNEENAAGGRIVTAPTNGAAGILPAVLHYFDRFCVHEKNSDSPENHKPSPPSDDEPLQQKRNDAIVRFLLTAGGIAMLYKKNASLSGAEVGCQGEVGVACSMAAGALTEVLGGSVLQVEQAAEIGMEHNLGLTCDPIGGLVQVPCIERNAMGAVKAINASRLALRGDGQHHVSLDRVIATMRQTGLDMLSKYKETSRGGLAVNVVEC